MRLALTSALPVALILILSLATASAAKPKRKTVLPSALWFMSEKMGSDKFAAAVRGLFSRGEPRATCSLLSNRIARGKSSTTCSSPVLDSDTRVLGL